MEFYTGTHRPHWVWKHDENWFVSNNQLRKIKKLSPARKYWALDSGGFTELATHGTWTRNATQYAEELQRYETEIGKLNWAAPQDWMCVDNVLTKTGKSVHEHQELTVQSVLTLRNLLGHALVIPVLQGREPIDFYKHVDLYEAVGFDLSSERVVGVGSIVHKQNDTATLTMLQHLSTNAKLRLHALGFKRTGIANVGQFLASSDSTSWSYEARKRQILLPAHAHEDCRNCVEFARLWTRELKQRFPCITN